MPNSSLSSINDDDERQCNGVVVVAAMADDVIVRELMRSDDYRDVDGEG